MRNGHPAHRDAVVYGLSGAVAGGVLALAAIPEYREWARIAVGPYLAGAAIALWLGRGGRRVSPTGRLLLAALVGLGVVVLPLALEVAWRAETGPGLHAQSEAIVTEEAAKAAIGGQDPYAADYSNGPLSERPLGTRTHFPYLPGMLLFGLPRALGGGRAVFDARVWFLAGAVAGLALAWRVGRWAEGGTGALQVLLILPTGALLASTGGDDLPVVALLLLSLTLLERRRPVAAAACLGLAMACKQTAWLAAPLFGLVLWRTAGRGRRGLALAAGASLPLAAVAGFILWNAGAFVEDAVRFPMGLGAQRSAAGTPTLGSSLIAAFPGHRWAGLLVLALLLLALAALMLVRRPPQDIAGAATRAGLLFAAAMILAPAGRIGYLVYPVNLLAWGTLLPLWERRDTLTV